MKVCAVKVMVRVDVGGGGGYWFDGRRVSDHA